MPRRIRTVLSMFMLVASAAVGAATRPSTLGDALAGEFALQSGDLAAASRHYLLAATASDDPAVAERATRVALMAGDPVRAARAIARWRALAPDSLAMHGAAMRLALRQGEVPAAVDEARALLDGARPGGFRTLLSGLGEARDDARIVARAVMREVLVEDLLPPDVQAWLAFAGMARRLGGERLSADIVDAAASRFPGDARIRLLRVARLREAGDADAARAGLEGLGDPRGLEPEIRRLAAAEFARLGDLVRAADWLAIGPQDDATYRQRAAWLAETNHRAGLQALYAEVRATGAVPAAPRRLLLGHLAEVLDLLDAAADWYLGLPIGPGRDLALLRGAGVLARLGRDQEALDALHELQVDESADGERRRDAYLYEAVLHRDRGRPDEALRVFDQGLSVFEHDPELLYSRGLLHESQDRVDAALADLGRIVEDDPGNAQALNALGYTLAERRGRLAEALGYVERAHALEPESAPILDSLGWIRFRLGDAAAALPVLQQAWDRLKDAEIAAHLGEVLWALGDRDAARMIWAEGGRIDPGNRALRRALQAHPVDGAAP